MTAVVFAADDATRRGGTHLLALMGDLSSGRLAIANLYTLEQLKTVASEQSAICWHPFFVTHGATLIIRSHNDAFDDAEAVARSVGVDVLTPAITVSTNAALGSVRSGRAYARDMKIRSVALEMARGRCERCDQQGFLTSSGEFYLETHHVVEVSQRGPDTIDNVIAVCPNCHRQAHFAANRVQVEYDFMKAIRRRRWMRPDLPIQKA